MDSKIWTETYAWLHSISYTGSTSSQEVDRQSKTGGLSRNKTVFISHFLCQSDIDCKLYMTFPEISKKCFCG